MNIVLSDVEIRILGCLIEKEMSTPDYYPLTVNALTNACNQKSNRDPVMDLNDVVVQDALDSLVKKHLAVPKSSSGSRAQKYAHRLSNPITNTMNFSRHELAVLCELLVRGPQTVGELRGRVARLAEFSDTTHVEDTLKKLRDRSDGPFVKELPRQPGRRESRFMHLFGGDTEPPAHADTSIGADLAGGRTDRVTELEQQIAELRGEVANIRQQLSKLLAARESDDASGGQ